MNSVVPAINDRTTRHSKHGKKQKIDIDTYNTNTIVPLICRNQIKGDTIMCLQ